MMPGILLSAQAIARQPDTVIPFWWIFTNGIARDIYYRQEISHWFQGTCCCGKTSAIMQP